MGYVETLPSGRYRGVPWNAAAGKRGKSASFDRFSEADAYWRAAEAGIDGDYAAAGVEVDRQTRSVPLLADYVLEWAGTVDGELATREAAVSHARELAAQWPTQRVNEITRPMVRAMLTTMRQRGRKPGTTEHRLSALRKVMAAAVEDGHRGDDPTVGVKGPSPVDRPHRVLSEQELYLMLVMLPDWLWAAALLSHDAGLRIGEIAGLRMHHLDLLHGTVTVADVVERDGTLREYPKGKKIADVPLSPRALRALRIHITAHPPRGRHGAVFAHPRHHGHCKPTYLREQWDRARRMVGLHDEPNPPRWHDLRHGCATALARAGVPAYDLAAILRHGDLTTAQTYIDEADLGAKRTAIGLAFGADVDADQETARNLEAVQ
ncbi:MAG: tyrosine-type recombinase/integrase [Sciscionella sp.]